MKRYEFKVVIFEGNDEFWESIGDKTGCEEVKECVRDCLATQGFEVGSDVELTLTNFNDDGA